MRLSPLFRHGARFSKGPGRELPPDAALGGIRCYSCKGGKSAEEYGEEDLNDRRLMDVCSVVVRLGGHVRDDRCKIDTSDDGDDRYAKEAFSKSMRLGEVSLRGLTPDKHALPVWRTFDARMSVQRKNTDFDLPCLLIGPLAHPKRHRVWTSTSFVEANMIFTYR